MSVEPDQISNILSIDSQVRRIVSEEMGVEIQTIFPDTDIIGGLGADKSDMDSMKIAVDHRFHIIISDENWKRMRSVRDIIHLVDVYLEIKQIEM